MYSCKYIIILQKFYSYTYSFNYTLNFKKSCICYHFREIKIILINTSIQSTIHTNI